MHILRDGGGDQRFSTPLNGGDHPFVHHLHQGDQWKDAGKFAQFSRPLAPVVNDISLTSISFSVYNVLFNTHHVILETDYVPGTMFLSSAFVPWTESEVVAREQIHDLFVSWDKVNNCVNQVSYGIVLLFWHQTFIKQQCWNLKLHFTTSVKLIIPTSPKPSDRNIAQPRAEPTPL